MMSRFRSMNGQFIGHFRQNMASLIGTLLYGRRAITWTEKDEIERSPDAVAAVSTLLSILTARGEPAVQEFATVLESEKVQLPKLAKELRGLKASSQQNLPPSQRRHASDGLVHIQTEGEVDRISRKLYSQSFIIDGTRRSPNAVAAVLTLLGILTARGEPAVQEFANVYESEDVQLPELAQELHGVAVAVTSQQNLPPSQQRQRSQASRHATLGDAFREASDELVRKLTEGEVDRISRKLYSKCFIIDAELQTIQSQPTSIKKASCLIDIISKKGDLCIKTLEDILRNDFCRANLADLIHI